MTRHEFLDNTVAFYAADPLGRRCVVKDPEVDSQACRYRSGERRCAIGRFVLPEYIDYIQDNGNRVDTIMYALPPEIIALGVAFLDTVQSLHDIPEYWNDTGLSKLGHYAVAVLHEGIDEYEQTGKLDRFNNVVAYGATPMWDESHRRLRAEIDRNFA